MRHILKFVTVLMVCAFASTVYADETKTHRIAFHVDQNDPQVMNLALNNLKNVRKYYDAKGEDVIIELVTYGPGLNMLIDDKSPVKGRIEALSLEFDNVQFSACLNTVAAITRKTGKAPVLMSEAVHVQSGVVRLVELQEDGFAYIKP